MDKSKGTLSLYSSLQLTEQMQGLDDESKLIFVQIPVLAIILKNCVREYENYSVKEIEGFIEADSIQVEETEVSNNRTNSTIAGSNVEFSALHEMLSTFDILFNTLNPLLSNEKILINLHIDIEPQKNYRPGYPIEKRGLYYLARQISAQIPVVTEDTNYGTLEKCYSIFICRDNIPKKEQYTITRYSMGISGDSTYSDVPEENYDLLELVMIRLGAEDYQGEKGLLDFLNILFYPHKKDFVSKLEHYIDLSSYEELKREANKMGGLGESVLERGIEQGIAQGANNVKDVIQKLMNGETEDSLVEEGYSETVITSAKEILSYMATKD